MPGFGSAWLGVTVALIRWVRGVRADRRREPGGEAVGVLVDVRGEAEIVFLQVGEAAVHRCAARIEPSVDEETMVLGHGPRFGPVGRSAATEQAGLRTLEELFEVWTWAQLGLDQKPIGILGPRAFFSPLLEFLDLLVAQRFVRPEHRQMVAVDEEPYARLERHEPTNVPK